MIDPLITDYSLLIHFNELDKSKIGCVEQFSSSS